MRKISSLLNILNKKVVTAGYARGNRRITGLSNDRHITCQCMPLEPEIPFFYIDSIYAFSKIAIRTGKGCGSRSAGPRYLSNTRLTLAELLLDVISMETVLITSVFATLQQN